MIDMRKLLLMLIATLVAIAAIQAKDEPATKLTPAQVKLLKKRHADRQVILQEINKWRSRNGRRAVTISEEMQKHTQAHAVKIAEAMADPGKHKRRNGGALCWQLNPSRTQYTFCLLCCHDDSKPWAEVLAWTQRRPQDAVASWVASQQGHRELLLTGSEIGIGIVYDAPRGPVWVVTLRTPPPKPAKKAQ